MSTIISTVVLFGSHDDGTSAVGGGGIIRSLLFLIVVGIILGVILWLVDAAPFIPAIFKEVIKWVIYVTAAVILINFLLSIVGHPLFLYN
jgi:hypothetical protein